MTPEQFLLIPLIVSAAVLLWALIVDVRAQRREREDSDILGGFSDGVYREREDDANENPWRGTWWTGDETDPYAAYYAAEQDR